MTDPVGRRLVAVLAGAVVAAVLAAEAADGSGQRQKAGKPKTETPEIHCQAVLGTGVETGRTFCDVATVSNTSGGVIICFPRHRGPATLTFDLHNRHVYSEDLLREGRAFRRYTATVVVITMDSMVLGRGTALSEFRTAADLLDRVEGPDGPKPVAVLASEPVTVEIPEGIDEIAIVGERLTTLRLDGREDIDSPGRLIASLSNIKISYVPAPAPTRRRR